MDSARDIFRDHPIGTTLGIWGSLIGVTVAYLWTRKIPFQLKIIQGRILAQAGLITGVCALGLGSYISNAMDADAADKLTQPMTQKGGMGKWTARSFEKVAEPAPDSSDHTSRSESAAAAPPAAPLR